jgi:1-acyl-sn-glycerol-3-phosphate acyltransferase
MGTDELFPMGWLGKIARLMRTYPVKQDSPDRKALRFTEDLLKRGEAVVIFPEGHVSPHGKLFPLQGGVIMMALRAGVPIVPVGIRNTEQMMPYRTFKLKRPTSPLEVIYGVPLTPEELSGGMKGRAAIDHGTQKLTAAILALSGQELSDQPWSIEMTGREDTPKSVA